MLDTRTWDSIFLEFDHLQYFVETGTRYGDTVEFMRRRFFEDDDIYSIEIDDTLYIRACERFKGTKVHLFQGNSASIICALTFRGPTLYYLDAHWWNNAEAGGGEGKEGFPLWQELQHILSLPPASGYTDVVVVDDVHAFGRAGAEGVSHVGWEVVSEEFLIDYMVGWTGKIYGDAFVMWKPDATLGTEVDEGLDY